ncbi:MAG: MFS transporter [Campylobacteraceae bacterium]|jgi:PPP family 3-phenylpropionic acid transporter|nr:MFS transporter [Campylobacteraceae bacterium]
MAFFNLSAFYFFYFAAVGVYIIFLPKVLHDIGYTPSDIGILFALAPLMRFLTPFLFLKHIELTKNIFKWSLYLSVLSSLLFYITINDFTLFLINNLILGICLSLVLPYIEVYAITQLGKSKYGKSRLYGSIGFMVVALVLARFLDNPNVALHYYLIATILTAYFSILIIKSEDNSIKADDTAQDKFSVLTYWPFWLSLFLMQVSFGGFYNFFTIYETAHGISLEMTSYLWAFGVVCEIIMLYFQAPILKNNLILVIKISIFLTIIRWLILYLYPDSLTMTFISQSIHALSFGLYHSAVIMYLYTLYSDKKLAQQFMFGFAYGLGGFIGAIIAGWTYGEYIFLYSALIALFAFGSLYIKNISIFR